MNKRTVISLQKTLMVRLTTVYSNNNINLKDCKFQVDNMYLLYDPHQNGSRLRHRSRKTMD